MQGIELRRQGALTRLIGPHRLRCQRLLALIVPQLTVLPVFRALIPLGSVNRLFMGCSPGPGLSSRLISVAHALHGHIIVLACHLLCVKALVSPHGGVARH